MLTVYSTNGSPGASTVAIYLAAQWASDDRQVLLVEADPAGGSLSQKLGMQYTPGTASFIAADKPATTDNLIEHAQDVLFSGLHLMPAPPSPAGASSIAEALYDLGDELRDVSESGTAVIIDAGRLNGAARTSQLATCASAVLVVSREGSQISSLEHLGGVLVNDAGLAGPLGMALCVGSSSLSKDEWKEHFGLNYVGGLELTLSATTDLSVFMAKGKRKARKLLSGLSKAGDALWEFACPAAAQERRPRLRPPEPDDADDDAFSDHTALPVQADGVPALSDPLASSPAAEPLAAVAAEMIPPSPSDGRPMTPTYYPAPSQSVEVHVHNQPTGAAAPPVAPAAPQPYAPYAYPPNYPPPPHAYPQPPPAQAPPQPYEYPYPGLPQHDYRTPYAPDDPQLLAHPSPPAQLERAMEPDDGRAGAFGPPPAHPAPPEIDETPSEPAPERPAVPTGSFRSWAAQMYGVESDHEEHQTAEALPPADPGPSAPDERRSLP